jgi:hypothetical protein
MSPAAVRVLGNRLVVMEIEPGWTGDHETGREARHVVNTSTDKNAASESLLRDRPPDLTPERADARLPRYEFAPDWVARRDAGLLPEGPEGMFGMLRRIWPDGRLSAEEAQWVLALREHTSWRELARYVVGDGNRITGMDLEEAARRALGLEPVEQDLGWTKPSDESSPIDR